MVVPLSTSRRALTWGPFSAPSVEPYGGSCSHTQSKSAAVSFQCSLCRAVWWFVLDPVVAAFVFHFQCSLCRAVWWFNTGRLPHPSRNSCFQCSLCRAVWWFVGFPIPVVNHPLHTFQCSLCRAVWWFPGTRVSPNAPSATFSAPSVEPYGGSSVSAALGAIYGDFQCSLCRAVWWFGLPEAWWWSAYDLSVLPL